MKAEQQCPVCLNNNKPNNLQLKQINLNIAVYLCEDPTCSYPEGYGWTTVARTLEQMYKQNKKLRKKKNLNKFIDKVCEETPTAATQDILQELNNIGQTTDDFNVDNLLEEELSKIECTKDVSLMDCSILNQTALCSETDLNVSEIIKDLEGERFELNQCNINADDNKPVVKETVCVDNSEVNSFGEEILSFNETLVQEKQKGVGKPIILNQFILPANTAASDSYGNIQSFDLDILNFE